MIYEMRLRSRLEALGPALERIQALVLQGTSCRELAGELRLIAEEALANVIRHGYGPDNEGDIVVLLEISDEFVRLEIRDSGPPYNPLDRPDPDILKPMEERSLGGLGVYLLRVLTDTQSYARLGAVNVLVLTKRRQPSLEGDSHNAEH